uniref:Immunoglobulin V-set domain-containing protein n=1 Tax=Myripristis murdjan TaxID=586833 RepID=A0A667ZMQ5_9TELE
MLMLHGCCSNSLATVAMRGELQYVFFYRDERIESGRQHPSFKNRTELKGRNMKNGDLSVILKNVKEGDSGTYECHFAAAGAKRRKRSPEDGAPISTIRLEVVDPGEFNWYRMTSDLRSVLFHGWAICYRLRYIVKKIPHSKNMSSRHNNDKLLLMT